MPKHPIQPLDFESLRAKRNEAVREVMQSIAKQMGWDIDEIHASFDPDACYCACAEGGPCEHDFQGWRDIYDVDGDVCGGEAVCSRCGMGAMSHSMHIGL